MVVDGGEVVAEFAAEGVEDGSVDDDDGVGLISEFLDLFLLVSDFAVA